MRYLVPPLTSAQIGDGSVVEDQRTEYKREVDLADARKKCDFVDDVVAFLNAGAGRIVVGVAERKGRFDRFYPIQGDPDATARRFASVIQDNVLPKPLAVSVGSLAMEGGFLMDVVIPEHRMRPYQNAINGAFLLRTGAKNTPVPRDAVQAMFTSAETMEADVSRLMAREDARVEARRLMQVDCPTLHVAIVPGAHYDRSAAPFASNDGGWSKTFPHFHDGGRHEGFFKGCEGGLEVTDTTFEQGRSTSRFFLGDDWLIHSVAAHPFRVTEGEGRLTLPEFGETLARHMRDIALVLRDVDVSGPFCIMMTVRGLRKGNLMDRAFPRADTIGLPRGIVAEHVDERSVVERFHALVVRASCYE